MLYTREKGVPRDMFFVLFLSIPFIISALLSPPHCGA